MITESMQKLAKEYIDFQKTSSSPFHAVQTLQKWFDSKNYQQLNLEDNEKLTPGKRYLIPHHDGKSIICVIAGKQNPADSGFNIAGAHTDSPVLRLRLNPWSGDQDLVKLETQNHGGIIARTWLDRPLKISGAVWKIERNKKGQVIFCPESNLPKLKKSLVQSNAPIAVIPDIAIHLDPMKNTQGEINFETMLSAFVGSGLTMEESKSLFWASMGQKPSDIDGFELCLSPWQNHELTGLEGCYITGPRHDDLAMVFAVAKALPDQDDQFIPEKTCIGAFFDAEETGSVTCSGAASSFLKDTLLRIASRHPAPAKSSMIESALNKSYFISADMAHAYHPAHPNKYDQNHRLKVNGGLVLKENANDRYATSGESGTMFRAICEASDVPLQGYINRQDLGCGSTIGPTLSAQLSCHGVDVGTAMWAMHSTGETMGTRDLEYACKAFEVFFKGAPS